MRTIAIVVVVVVTACATDPARRLEANGQDVEITPDHSYIRGDEHLDEEEFYALVGDEKATKTIHDSRAQGESAQPLGVGLAAGGAALAVGGYGLFYVTTKGTKPTKILGAPYDTYAGYAGMLGGLAAAIGGGYLWFDGRNKALGTERLFDDKYALNSLETARYGSGGATQSTVAKVELETASGAPTYCSVGTTPLKPLKALDDKNRGIKLDGERAGWFTWAARPAHEALSPAHDAVISPMSRSLAHFGSELVVDVTVNAPTHVGATLALKPDWGCPKPYFAFGGPSGNSGDSGPSGAGAQGEGGSGGPGGNGGTGADGGRGVDVDVEAAAVAGPGGEQLVLVAVAERGRTDSPALAVFDPAKAGKLVIAATGGDGGGGGGGGPGGGGYSYGSGDTCRNGGNGGSGGQGGRGGDGGTVHLRTDSERVLQALAVAVDGGRGGDGGTVHLRTDSERVLQALAVAVDGGRGGMGGGGGGGGSGGNGDSCGSDHGQSGAAGAPGQSGPDGVPGRPGKADISVAAKAGLRMIGQALATMHTDKGGATASAADAPAETMASSTSAPAPEPAPKKANGKKKPK